MNILLINHYAGSPALGMEYRPYYLAREWVRAGHRVQILAADFSHVRAHVLKHYTWDISLDRMIDAYSRTVSGRFHSC